MHRESISFASECLRKLVKFASVKSVKRERWFRNDYTTATACAYVFFRFAGVEAIHSMIQSLQHKEHVVANLRRVRRLALNVKSASSARST